MIKIEKVEILGWEAAIRGMRNPMNSWDKSDSEREDEGLYIGKNDCDLMKQLAKSGPVHAKYRRMITVYADITAPLYWWKEFDTYKVGTVANSCSTMHKIHEKEFTIEDFSCEHLDDIWSYDPEARDMAPMIGFETYMYRGTHYLLGPENIRDLTINILNRCRELYIQTNDKKYWWQMIQLLPSSYNQKWTVMMNYEVLANIYKYRRDHKLDEWRELCKWIETLPYSEIITCKEGNEN